MWHDDSVAPSPAVRLGPLLALLAASCAGGSSPRSAAPLEQEPGAPVLRVHFLDVGQGDAALLEFPCAAMLVDTGGEGPELWPDPEPPRKDGLSYAAPFDSVAALRRALDAFFRRRHDLDRTLHLLAVTHPHLDHTRGVPMVLRAYRVLNVIDNGSERGSGGAQVRALHDWVVSTGAGHRDIRLADIPAQTGLTDGIIDPIACPQADPRIRALWGAVDRDPGWAAPPAHRPNRPWPFEDQNNHSVVLRVDFGRAAFLFSGDLEEPAIETLLERTRGTDLLDVSVYKVGHHGSWNGTTAAFVAAMTPEVAVVSMSPAGHRARWSAWRFGLPRRVTLERLARGLSGRRPPRQVLVGEGSERFAPLPLQAAVYATGWDGTVVVEATLEGTLRVRTGR
jgi:competence protein ComEC